MPCKDCQAWIYDIKTAQPIKRRGERQRRLPSQPPPCQFCPKKSPENEKNVKLSRKNIATLQLYFAARSGGLAEHEKVDPIVRRNLAILEQIFTNWDRQRNAEEIQTRMMGFK